MKLNFQKTNYFESDCKPYRKVVPRTLTDGNPTKSKSPLNKVTSRDWWRITFGCLGHRLLPGNE